MLVCVCSIWAVFDEVSGYSLAVHPHCCAEATGYGSPRENKAVFEPYIEDDETLLWCLSAYVPITQFATKQQDAHRLYTLVVVPRQQVMDHLERNREVFEPYMEDDETFGDYLERMRGEAEWGGNQELVAASQLYKVRCACRCAAPRAGYDTVRAQPVVGCCNYQDLSSSCLTCERCLLACCSTAPCTFLCTG